VRDNDQLSLIQEPALEWIFASLVRRDSSATDLADNSSIEPKITNNQPKAS
jgi:hypothetical protein